MKKHPLIGKGAKGVCEGCFILVFQGDFYLVIPKITIQEIIIFITGYPFKNLIQEG